MVIEHESKKFFHGVLQAASDSPRETCRLRKTMMTLHDFIFQLLEIAVPAAILSLIYDQEER